MILPKLLVSPAVRGAVTVTLNRPDKGNALDRETLALLIAALDRLDADASVRVVVLRGEGKHFCSGVDGRADLAGDAPAVHGRQAPHRRRPPRLHSVPQPSLS